MRHALACCLAGCLAVSCLGAADEGRGSEATHFVLESNDATFNQAEADRAEIEMEEDYDLVVGYLGRDRIHVDTVTVVFEGNMFVDDRRRTPHVDRRGRIHLYRSPAASGEYLSSFPHELVHALRAAMPDRMQRLSTRGARFLEEGFAEAVALEAHGGVDRYPYFGTSPDVVVAYLIDSGLQIPLLTVLERHGALNLGCELQSYPPRASFIRYLIRRLGRKKVIELAFSSGPYGADMYEKASGSDFDALEQAWRVDVMARGRAVGDIQLLGDQWRRSIERIGLRICEPGTDY